MGLGISPHETPNANALLAKFRHPVTHTGSDSRSGTPPTLDLERSQLCRSPSTKHFFTVQPMVTPPLLSLSRWSLWYATAKEDSSPRSASCPNLSGRTSGTTYTSDRTPNSLPTSEDLYGTRQNSGGPCSLLAGALNDGGTSLQVQSHIVNALGIDVAFCSTSVHARANFTAEFRIGRHLAQLWRIEPARSVDAVHQQLGSPTFACGHSNDLGLLCRARCCQELDRPLHGRSSKLCRQLLTVLRNGIFFFARTIMEPVRKSLEGHECQSI